MNYFDIVLRCFEHDPQTPAHREESMVRAIGKAEHWQKCQSRSRSPISLGDAGRFSFEVAVSSDSLNHLRSAVTVERVIAGRGDR